MTEPNVKEDDDVVIAAEEAMLVSLTAPQPELIAASSITVATEVNLDKRQSCTNYALSKRQVRGISAKAAKNMSIWDSM